MKAEYGFVDRLLHRLALASPARATTFHEFERNKYLEDSPEDPGGHVFVTGLARAGTTILLRDLYATGHFGSLLYRDMPFVLAPNLWASVSRNARKSFDPVERAHGDGIAVSLDSPEAFDEVFWRVFHGTSYIREDGLLPHHPKSRAIARYRAFIRLILRRSGKRRYLSKNNNNILRLDALADAMPDCIFLLVIREPLAHADSLLRQHLRSAASSERFRRDYIRWLGHHEFGIDHRPFRFPGSPDGDPKSFDYWLATWLACYQSVEQVVAAHSNILVIPYEELCAEPQTWAALCERIGISSAGPREVRLIVRADPNPGDRTLASEAQSVHGRYIEHVRAWLPTHVADHEQEAKFARKRPD